MTSFFVIFFAFFKHLMMEKDRKSCFSIKKCFRPANRRAPVCWSKYTTCKTFVPGAMQKWCTNDHYLWKVFILPSMHFPIANLMSREHRNLANILKHCKFEPSFFAHKGLTVNLTCYIETNKPSNHDWAFPGI